MKFFNPWYRKEKTNENDANGKNGLPARTREKDIEQIVATSGTDVVKDGQENQAGVVPAEGAAALIHDRFDKSVNAAWHTAVSQLNIINRNKNATDGVHPYMLPPLPVYNEEILKQSLHQAYDDDHFSRQDTFNTHQTFNHNYSHKPTQHLLSQQRQQHHPYQSQHLQQQQQQQQQTYQQQQQQTYQQQQQPQQQTYQQQQAYQQKQQYQQQQQQAYPNQHQQHPYPKQQQQQQQAYPKQQQQQTYPKQQQQHSYPKQQPDNENWQELYYKSLDEIKGYKSQVERLKRKLSAERTAILLLQNEKIFYQDKINMMENVQKNLLQTLPGIKHRK